MTGVDFGIAGLILASTLIGVLRGFARESLGLATWVFAFLLAWLFAAPVVEWLAPHIGAPSVRVATAYAALFLGGLLAGGILTSLVVDAIRGSRFSPADRTLGAGLGLIRGLFLVVVAVWLLRQTPAIRDAWWSQSRLIGHFEVLADELDAIVPRAWLQALQAAPVSSSAPST